MILNLNEGRMRVEMTKGTDVGTKAVNEDLCRFGVAESRLDAYAGPMYLFGVFDGHGGANAAKYVNDHLFERIAEDLERKESTDMTSLFRNAFVGIQNEMKEAESEKSPITDLPTCGTTAAVLAIVKDKMWVAHVGDTRVIVAWKEGTKWLVERLTKDHRCSDPDEAKSVLDRGGIILKNRVARRYESLTGHVRYNGVLALTRALGHFWSYCPSTGLYTVSSEPDTSSRRLNKDCLIVIATDGITDALTDLEIINKFLALDKDQRRHIARLRQDKCCADVVAPQYFIADEIIKEAKARRAAQNSKADNMTAITLRVTIST